MGAGKTTVGKALARRLRRPVRRSRSRDRAPRIRPHRRSLRARGRAGLPARARRRSRRSVLARGDRPVIALGGGSLGNEATRALLREHALVAWLDVDRDDGLVARRRARAAADRRSRALRPSLERPSRRLRRRGRRDRRRSRVGELGRRRARPAGLDACRRARARRRAGPDLPRRRCRGRRPGARAISCSRAASRASRPPASSGSGARSRTPGSSAAIACSRWAAARSPTWSVFAAATFRRGIDWIAAPSTLVGQVDAAIGGKTAIDVAAKNDVGAFWTPQAVLADPGLLASLPAAEWAAGFAECVKTALLAGGPLWELVRGLRAAPPERGAAARARAALRGLQDARRRGGSPRVGPARHPQPGPHRRPRRRGGRGLRGRCVTARPSRSASSPRCSSPHGSPASIRHSRTRSPGCSRRTACRARRPVSRRRPCSTRCAMTRSARTAPTASCCSRASDSPCATSRCRTPARRGRGSRRRRVTRRRVGSEACTSMS